MKKAHKILLSSILLGGMAANSALAFSDIEGDQAEAILALKKRGVVSGIDNEHFAPKGKISFAQSVQIIVKGLDLNLDLLRFIKQPVASDIYTNIPNNAWYADAFIIAHYNGLEIPKDVNPNEMITREQFGNMLVHALERKGNFPTIKMYINIKDEAQITPEYQGAMQRLLLYKITDLDKNGNLNPKAELTRGEAAKWVHNASKMVDAHTQKPPQNEEVSVSVEKVNDDVNKVTLSRGSKPSTGYGIEITGIRFEQDGRAVISYKLIDPPADSMTGSAITEPKASTYISSKFQPVTEK